MDTTKKEIWDKLSQIDVTPYIQKLNDPGDEYRVDLDYVPWADAHALMMEQGYPEYSWTFHLDFNDTNNRPLDDAIYYLDGSAVVHCCMKVEKHLIITSLPVTNPTAQNIHNTKQRCRTKALAEFGLGFNLWRSDVPPATVKLTVVDNGSTKTEDEDKDFADSVQKLWDAADLDNVDKKTDAVKAFSKFRKAMENRYGYHDGYFEGLWETVCEEHGWKA